MEKIIYALWKPRGMTEETFAERLHHRLAPMLTPLVHHLRLNLRDSSVRGGNSPCFSVLRPSPDALVQLWVNTAYPPTRAGIDAAMIEYCGHCHAWLVCESTPLPNTAFPPNPGQRTEGFAQIALLLAPSGLEHSVWRHHWQDQHTRQALDLQAIFEYRQNLVVRALTPGAPEIWAIVEECFPIDALTDRTLYYAHPGDPQGTDANEAAMMRSCEGFIGANGCDVFPTSQYDIR